MGEGRMLATPLLDGLAWVTSLTFQMDIDYICIYVEVECVKKKIAQR